MPKTPEKKPINRQLPVYLRHELRVWVEAEAERQGCSLASVLRRLVEAAMADEGGEG